ncbi:hypothetical protein C8J56DRAFT_922881 [Mycena floridula]|nr:hypothetical protein C8J56DRAFT_922881 [Mycena floridula]
MSSWSPKRSFAEVNQILNTPGILSEVETCLIDGRVQRVYKNLWPSLRIFWLWATREHADLTYIVFEQERYSFSQMLQRSVHCAAFLRDVYGITKGDRVAICSRNYPQFLVVFWACHLIGAVSVLINAQLPLEGLKHCLSKTDCKLVIVDSARADLLERIISTFGSSKFLVIEAQEGKGTWRGMDTWKTVVAGYQGEVRKVLTEDPAILPEDDATIVFTSGTTGLPKGVLSTQRMFLTNVGNSFANATKTLLRRGDPFPPPPAEGPQKAILLSTPMYHVTATSLTLITTLMGMKLVLTRKWVLEDAVKLIKKENVTAIGGVPSLAYDLTSSSLVGHPMESFMYGGSAAHESLLTRIRNAFPGTNMSQAYGLTESNATAVGIGGEDYLARPKSTGSTLPVNDMLVMNITTNKRAAPGEVGEVWLRGPNVMKCYWGDPEATEKVLTKDGWLRSGDLGYIDKEGFLYITDRSKDLIIRGGENIDSVSVENALYAEPAVLEAAAVAVPDDRLGELVAALVTLRPDCPPGKVTEMSLLALVTETLPRYAVPVMILVDQTPFEHTASGKIIKGDLRKFAAKEWLKRATKSKL